MRHLWTVIAAIVIGPAAWLLIAFGQAQSATAFGKAVASGTWPAADFVGPLLLLAGAGILLGLLGTLRFSPLGAVLTGLVYVATYAAVMIDGKDAYKLVNYKITIFKHEALMAGPVGSGATLLLGSLLLVGVASVSRWRRWPARAAETVPDESAPAAGSGTDETKDFWTPSTPVSTPLGPYSDETPDRTVPNQFGSPWRTPPGENAAEEKSR